MTLLVQCLCRRADSLHLGVLGLYIGCFQGDQCVAGLHPIALADVELTDASGHFARHAVLVRLGLSLDVFTLAAQAYKSHQGHQ